MYLGEKNNQTPRICNEKNPFEAYLKSSEVCKNPWKGFLDKLLQIQKTTQQLCGLPWFACPSISDWILCRFCLIRS